jgi:hypothetical protein
LMLRVLSPSCLRYAFVGVRCSCCGLRLIDLRKIKVSSDVAIGPECGKHYPELYPCRHIRHDGEISLEQFHGHYTAKPAFVLYEHSKLTGLNLDRERNTG